MSKRHPNNGGTFTKGKRKMRRVTHSDDPRLDPSKPELWVSQKSRDLIAEWINDPAKMHQMARKWTTGRI
jgi:hypothetical protein